VRPTGVMAATLQASPACGVASGRNWRRAATPGPARGAAHARRLQPRRRAGGRAVCDRPGVGASLGAGRAVVPRGGRAPARPSWPRFATVAPGAASA